MQKYNSIQKVLIFLSIITFISFLYGLFLILKPAEKPTVLGTKDYEVKSVYFENKDYETKLSRSDSVSLDEDVTTNDESIFYLPGISIVNAGDLSFNASKLLQINEGLVFISSERSHIIMVHDTMVIIHEGSEVFYDAENETLSILKGSISVNNETIESNKMLRFEVDRLYIRDVNWQKLQVDKRFRKLFDLLVALDYFEEDFLVQELTIQN